MALLDITEMLFNRAISGRQLAYRFVGGLGTKKNTNRARNQSQWLPTGHTSEQVKLLMSYITTRVLIYECDAVIKIIQVFKHSSD